MGKEIVMPNNLSPLEEIQRRLLELEEWSR